ncbi:MAG: MFS transporter [Gemmataceae bacterium]|nr:MFS transporter [Gemmataceae bacterium]
MNPQQLSGAGPRTAAEPSAAIMPKVTRRLIPFLLILYICNLLDRANVSFARLTMQAALGMSDTVFAFGTGLFYCGYLLFEVPSNLILRRTGARVWIARIMMTWGLVSCATMFVTGPGSFFTVRILLGVAEAGFFPGIILYLTYWFPARERARAVSRFMAANALGAIINYPISGAIMEHLDQVGGLHGWQWVFLLEGIPSVLMGVLVLFYLTDRPEQAAWLTEDERSWLAERMSEEEQYREKRHGADLWRTAGDPRVWLLILVYFTVACGANGSSFYMPELVSNRFPDQNKLEVGLIATLPSICALIGMLVNGALSDRTGKRSLHVAGAALLGAAGWALAAVADSPMLGLIGLCLAQTGTMSMLPPFWSLPTSFLSGAALAGGIALINSVANVGGLAGPSVLGLIRDQTGGLTAGLLALAATMAVGGILVLFARYDPTLDQRLAEKEGQ